MLAPIARIFAGELEPAASDERAIIELPSVSAPERLAIAAAALLGKQAFEQPKWRQAVDESLYG